MKLSLQSKVVVLCLSVVLVLVFLDAATTYVGASFGFEEANPDVAALFVNYGLEFGLLIAFSISVGPMMALGVVYGVWAYLCRNDRFLEGATSKELVVYRWFFPACVVFFTGLGFLSRFEAVVNNFQLIMRVLS